MGQKKPDPKDTCIVILFPEFQEQAKGIRGGGGRKNGQPPLGRGVGESEGHERSLWVPRNVPHLDPGQWFSAGSSLEPHGCLAMSGELWGCDGLGRKGCASSGERSGMQLSTLPCPGSPPQELVPPQMSVVPRCRNPDLVAGGHTREVHEVQHLMFMNLTIQGMPEPCCLWKDVPSQFHCL